MKSDDKNVQSEREQTDASLRTEREKTDEAILSNKKMLEDDADSVISLARKNADEVLSTARDKADSQLVRSGISSVIDRVITKKRADEDRVLENERNAADKNIDIERKEIARTLRRLMPLEREATDRTLLTERARSDDALGNRDDFLGMVCHDLRNLLSGIVTQTELLSYEISDVGDDKTVANFSRQIQQYVAQMNRLIGDLVDVASIDSGKLSILPKSVDTSSVITEAVSIFKGMAAAKGITLISRDIQGEIIAELDDERILQVLTNLCMNSIKFTPPGGTITLSRRETEGNVLFSVTDTGKGIPEEMLERVFERFWQLGENDRRGLGLGLYISKSIIEAHKGTIWAESQPGEGSTFVFTLPLVNRLHS